MRRCRAVKELAAIERVWPLFAWKQCMNCDDEVRREWLWRTYWHSCRHPSTLFRPVDLIVCRRCAPTQAAALAYFKARETKEPGKES